MAKLKISGFGYLIFRHMLELYQLFSFQSTEIGATTRKSMQKRLQRLIAWLRLIQKHAATRLNTEFSIF